MVVTTPSLDHFGRLLMHRVRDWRIRDWQARVTGGLRGGPTSVWSARLLAGLTREQRKSISCLVPAIVDDVIDHVLWMFEQEGSLTIRVRSDGGGTDDLAADSDGLSGEPHGDEGWIARFSEHPNEGVPFRELI
jgi:hypothetical protein